MKISKRFLVAAFMLSASGAVAAGETSQCHKQSPAHTVALMELYTSEGCNSCPPADAFVRGLYQSGFGADQVVPLSLHVDYWDSLGWRDRFASASYTQRQYWLASAVHAHSVYTPEIFLGGREESEWRGREFQENVRAINGRPARAAIELTQRAAPPGSVAVDAKARIMDIERGAPFGLFFAVYENDLVSEVHAGENRGATLHHGFVVRQWSTPVPVDSQGNAVLNWQSAIPPDAAADHLGFVAFVENTRTGEILQALALPTCSAH